MKNSRPAPIRVPLFCAVLILMGCADLPNQQGGSTPEPTPSSFTCNMFSEKRWRELRFGVDTPELYAETVERVWGVEKWSLPLFQDGYTRLWGMWNTDSSVSSGQRHAVQFDWEGKLLRVAVSWSSKQTSPTLAQVIDCLGPPEYYISAFVEDRTDWHKFSLWYVEKGFVIRGSSSRRESIGRLNWPTIHLGTLMQSGGFIPRQGDLVVVAPGNLEQMLSAIYGPSLQAWERCLIMPWPGSIEETEILPFAEYLRCAL